MLTAGKLPVDVLLEVRADVCELPVKRDVWLESGAYVARLARSEKDRFAAYRLRFIVRLLQWTGLYLKIEGTFGGKVTAYRSMCELPCPAIG